MPELLKPIKPLARSTNTYKFESKCWCEFTFEAYFAGKWLFQITNQFELLILFNFFQFLVLNTFIFLLWP